jgi:hypothetical protein
MYLLRIHPHDAHKFKKVEKQRLRQALEFESPIDMLSVYITVGADKVLDVAILQVLQLDI